jgi:hypothetical protein
MKLQRTYVMIDAGFVLGMRRIITFLLWSKLDIIKAIHDRISELTPPRKICWRNNCVPPAPHYACVSPAII